MSECNYLLYSKQVGVDFLLFTSYSSQTHMHADFILLNEHVPCEALVNFNFAAGASLT